jgi:hypothetical protein
MRLPTNIDRKNRPPVFRHSFPARPISDSDQRQVCLESIEEILLRIRTKKLSILHTFTLSTGLCLRYLINMNKRIFKLLFALFLFSALPAADIGAQEEESAYGSKFFDQLRSIFGKFRDSDLQKVFQEAQPIQCSELIARKGEWRPVAFFNEDRSLGDWCRESLEEVKAEMTVYTFKGTCSGDRGTIKVGSEFPTAAGIKAYGERKIELDQVDIAVNDPVNAALNPKTMAYTFDLPYLFRENSGSRKLYTFIAPDADSTYATDVKSHWECKAVSSKDVTYRFLICRVSTAPQRIDRNRTWEPSFGSSAFFILSDGMEAQASVNVTFGNAAGAGRKPEEAEPGPSSPARPALKRDK